MVKMQKLDTYMCGADGRVYQATAAGWRIVDVEDRRFSSSRLDVPSPAGSVDHLAARAVIEPGDGAASRAVVEPGDHLAARAVIEPGDYTAARAVVEPGDHLAARAVIEPGTA